jgi:hypothetical protein
MSEIVERLRYGEPCIESCGDRCKVRDTRSGCTCAEAADEITRLEARVKEMEEVCRKLIAYEQAMDGGRDIDAMDYYAQASELARAALSQPAQPAPEKEKAKRGFVWPKGAPEDGR